MPVRYYEHLSCDNHTADYYEKHPNVAFKDGFCNKVKVKRHRERKYDHFHYYLPTNLSPIFRFLKKYFHALDAQYDDTPPSDRYRASEFEYVDVAIFFLHLIRQKVQLGEPLVAGSQTLCAIPWAVFGPNPENRLAQHYFPTLTTVFQYYGQFLDIRGINIVNVARPINTDPDFDPLRLLADLFNLSVNLVLSCGLLLLYDIVCHCGPDSLELHAAFSNNFKKKDEVEFITWHRAREIMMPTDQPDLNTMLALDLANVLRKRGNKYSITSPYCPFKATKRDYRNTYFDVSVADIVTRSHADLIFGEKVELYKPPKDRVQFFTQNWDDVALEAMGDEEDDDEEIAELREMDEHMRRIVNEEMFPIPTRDPQTNQPRYGRDSHGCKRLVRD